MTQCDSLGTSGSHETRASKFDSCMLRRIKQHEAEQEQCISFSLACQNTACFISMGVEETYQEGERNKIQDFLLYKKLFLKHAYENTYFRLLFDLFTTVKIPLSSRDPLALFLN